MGHSLLVDRYCQDKISEFMYLSMSIDVLGFRVIGRVGWIYYVWLVTVFKCTIFNRR